MACFCFFGIPLKMSTTPLFGWGVPGVDLPVLAYFSSSFIKRSTTSGWSLYRFFFSATSFVMSNSCIGGASSGALPGLGADQPPEPGHISSFHFPCRIENEPLIEWWTVASLIGFGAFDVRAGRIDTESTAAVSGRFTFSISAAVAKRSVRQTVWSEVVFGFTAFGHAATKGTRWPAS